MKKIQQLIAHLQTEEIDDSAVVDSIKQQLLDGNIQQHELVECLHKMNTEQQITKTLYEQFTALIQSSNAETIIASNDKTRVAAPDETQLDNNATILANTPKLAPEQDKTQLKSNNDNAATNTIVNSDKTIIASNESANTTNETILATHQQVDKSNAKTQFNDDVQITDIDPAYNRNQAKTLINTDGDSVVNGQASSQPYPSHTDAQTVVTRQQTLQEQTQQSSTYQPDEQPKKLEPGAIIRDRFILKQVIGSGGMSVVFRALDLRKQEAKNLNPYVAIKVLGDTFKHHPLSLLALERETQKIQSLAHPNIITVYDFDRDGENIYMTMECLEGQSLDVVIRNNKHGMPFSEAQSIISGMCNALIYAHSKNIIHSDLKPENVYYTKKNITKVLDFGIARAQKTSDNKAVDTVFDAGSLSALTPPYASLEMLLDKDPDPRDDIYALACVTYKLLSGVHPYKNLQADKAQEAGLQPVKIDGLNRRQWQTLSNGLAFKAKNRTQSVEEFLDGIMPKKRGWVYALIAGIVLAIGLSGYLGTSITESNALPKIKLTQEQKDNIKKYLEIGELYYSLGYLATPPGDSALDQYEKVLEIDPSNKPAIEGKKQLVIRYQELAATSLDLKKFDESLQLLETALLIDPDNEDLLESQKEVKKLRASQ